MDGALGVKIAEFGWQIFAAIVLTVYHFLTINRKATKDEISRIVEGLTLEKEGRQKEENRLRDRVRDLESQIKHLPTKDDFQELENSIIRIDEQVKSTNENIKGLASSVKTIDQFLRASK